MKLSFYMDPEFEVTDEVDMVRTSILMFTSFAKPSLPRKVQLFSFFVPMTLRQSIGFTYVKPEEWNTEAEREFRRAIRPELFR